MRRDEITKVILPESEIPKQWYNVVADMPNKPAAYRNPATLDIIQAEDMKAIFPDELIKQEMSTERYIDIPKKFVKCIVNSGQTLFTEQKILKNSLILLHVFITNMREQMPQGVIS